MKMKYWPQFKRFDRSREATATLRDSTPASGRPVERRTNVIMSPAKARFTMAKLFAACFAGAAVQNSEPMIQARPDAPNMSSTTQAKMGLAPAPGC